MDCKQWLGQRWEENTSTVHKQKTKMKKKMFFYVKKYEEKETICWTVGQWNETQCATFIISQPETGFCLYKKTTWSVQKKEHLNVQVDFQDFFIQFKKK